MYNKLWKFFSKVNVGVIKTIATKSRKDNRPKRPEEIETNISIEILKIPLWEMKDKNKLESNIWLNNSCNQNGGGEGGSPGSRARIQFHKQQWV